MAKVCKHSVTTPRCNSTERTVTACRACARSTQAGFFHPVSSGSQKGNEALRPYRMSRGVKPRGRGLEARRVDNKLSFLSSKDFPANAGQWAGCSSTQLYPGHKNHMAEMPKLLPARGGGGGGKTVRTTNNLWAMFRMLSQPGVRRRRFLVPLTYLRPY